MCNKLHYKPRKISIKSAYSIFMSITQFLQVFFARRYQVVYNTFTLKDNFQSYSITIYNHNPTLTSTSAPYKIDAYTFSSVYRILKPYKLQPVIQFRSNSYHLFNYKRISHQINSKINCHLRCIAFMSNTMT